jgi:FtsZ-binding cell division protein ZapB
VSQRPETPVALPSAFISYSWDSDVHKRWTKEFATRLRRDGVDVKLDQWEMVPGDQLPAFMEKAIRENDYVLIICTPKYKDKSDSRRGGVGYEGDIMTGEVFTTGNHRKFIPVLRERDWPAALPTWLTGKYGVDLHGDPFSEEQYKDLLATIHERREKAPPLGEPPRARTPFREALKEFTRRGKTSDEDLEPIKIEGVVADEVGEPRNDGTRGSGLYAVPFRLSRVPSPEWSDLFVRIWAHPPSCSLRHRPRSVRVSGDRIVLTQTTIEEVKEVHRETLKLVVEETNRQFAALVRERQRQREEEDRRRQQHKDDVQRMAGEIDFD